MGSCIARPVGGSCRQAARACQPGWPICRTRLLASAGQCPNWVSASNVPVGLWTGDGIGAIAQFSSLTDIAVDPSGDLFVITDNTHVLRAIRRVVTGR